jgi:glycosyltransferase involved in cell wall biosynthesis
MTPLIRRWIPRTQRVVSLSEEMSRALASLGVLPSRIELIPNAVDEARFSQACDWAQLRASLGLPAEAFLFLCVARNHPQKDLPTLLSAFKKLTTDLPEKPLHLVLVGRGVPALRPSLQTSGLESQVTLLEFQADSTARGIPQFPPQPLVDLYRAADAFVLSSVLEGFSSALLEAMAAGLPVIATAVPGIVDRLKHGKNGLLCQPRDPGALAKLMRLVCEDAPLASDLAANGRKSSLSHSWSATAQAYLNLYERMILERATKHPPHPTR